MDQPLRSDRPAFLLHNPAGLYDPAPNGYSHLAVLAPGARLVLPAGLGGEDADGNLPADFRVQLRLAFANLLTALAAAGAGPGDIAKLTVLVVDHNEEKLHIFVVPRYPRNASFSSMLGLPLLRKITLAPSGQIQVNSASRNG
jgi:enamine deaminase RidA (YjgF/YER057c/UK114 family)